MANMRDENTLPIESARTLDLIEAETESVVAHVEAFGVEVTPGRRAFLVSLCLINETGRAARELRERVGLNLN